MLRSPIVLSASLVTLHLYNCLELCSASISCPNLETLNLTYCVSLVKLSLQCPKLASLLCAGCKQLSDSVVLGVLAACPALNNFDLKACTHLQPTTLVAAEQITKARVGQAPAAR
eukprot:scaffold81370_cov30-Tisochrysis_lutea.AAC.2